MYKTVLNKIEEYQNITIFRHLRPDGDAIFSSCGLKYFIEHNFKDKEVKLCGEETYDVLPVKEEVSDEFINNSLAIILDVSGTDRTDDQRFFNAKERLIIDHHPGNPTHAETLLQDTSCCATAELLAKLFYSGEFSEYEVSPKTCEYLYCGILTDSNSFSTSNTTADTLLLASRLVKDGNLKPSEYNEMVFNDSYESFIKTTKLRSNLKIEDGIGYLILDNKDLEEIGFTANEAKNRVNEFARIKELNIWAIFVYDEESGLYNGSLRSRRNFVINEICNNYNGGGHKNACGVKRLSRKDITNLFADLRKI
ncbi:MAG: bifunctional oligoribonuclease/PAP phosphatase NrnA [Erysipelotrichaceae bacterium]|nr:bifunctional oligoribonuclease/PAP phosphatase NrnA [Erysipelotrichaceae bacterium]